MESEEVKKDAQNEDRPLTAEDAKATAAETEEPREKTPEETGASEVAPPLITVAKGRTLFYFRPRLSGSLISGRISDKDERMARQSTGSKSRFLFPFKRSQARS